MGEVFGSELSWGLGRSAEQIKMMVIVVLWLAMVGVRCRFVIRMKFRFRVWFN